MTSWWEVKDESRNEERQSNIKTQGEIGGGERGKIKG